MKTVKISCAIALLILVSFATAHPTESARKTKIGVMKFKVSKNLGEDFQTFIHDVFMDQMVQSGKYTVVDLEEIDRVLRYIAKSQPNISQKAARKQANNQLDIEKIYIGSLAKVGSKFYLTMKVLNLDLSVDRTARDSVDSEDQLEQSIMTIAQILLVGREEAMRLKVKAAAEARAKAEEEERKRTEAQRGKEVADDGRFVAYSKGVVIDTHTRLMWAARDNWIGISWSKAKAYCEDYRGAGYEDWRMPTTHDLVGIIDPSKKNKSEFNATKLIEVSSCCVWSSETYDSEAAYMDFSSGEMGLEPKSSSEKHLRALPVRPDK